MTRVRWGELVGAFMLLTRLPVAPLALRQPAMARLRDEKAPSVTNRLLMWKVALRLWKD